MKVAYGKTGAALEVETEIRSITAAEVG